MGDKLDTDHLVFRSSTSSSHALIGGMSGAEISAAGLAVIKWSTVKLVAMFMIVSPVIGKFMET